MDEIMRFKAVLVETDLGYNRKRKMVIDLETGEVIARWHEGDVIKAFADGANTIIKEVQISREVNDTGIEYIVINEENWPGEPQELFSFWRNPRRPQTNKTPKHTGGKRSYVKLYLDQIKEVSRKVTDNDVGMLIRLAQNVDWKTGILVDRRTKKPLNFVGLLKHSGYKSARTLANRINALRQAGILIVDHEGRYVISPLFMRKG